MTLSRGAGKQRLPPELLRSNIVRIGLTPGQFADLQCIADGWGVPPASAAYAMIAEFLAWCRCLPLQLGADQRSMALSSALRLVAAMRDAPNLEDKTTS